MQVYFTILLKEIKAVFILSRLCPFSLSSLTLFTENDTLILLSYRKNSKSKKVNFT